MTTIAIAIASVCIIAAAIYTIVLSKAKEPDFTNEELAEMSVSKEWWQVD